MMEMWALKNQFNRDTRLKQASPPLKMERNADTSKLLIAQKSQQHYISFPVSQVEVFVQLVQKKLRAPIPTCPWRLPYHAWFDEEARYSNHSGATGPPLPKIATLHAKNMQASQHRADQIQSYT